MHGARRTTSGEGRSFPGDAGVLARCTKTHGLRAVAREMLVSPTTVDVNRQAWGRGRASEATWHKLEQWSLKTASDPSNHEWRGMSR